MKLRKLRDSEKFLIDEIIIKFGSECWVKQQNLFADDFGRVYLYTGGFIDREAGSERSNAKRNDREAGSERSNAKRNDLNAYALGLNIGKIAGVFAPTLDFLHFIKPSRNIFSINKEEALKFMAGHDLTEEIPEGLENGSYVAVKFEDLIIGVGKYTDKIIKNKLPKDRKIRIMQRQEKENEEEE